MPPTAKERIKPEKCTGCLKILPSSITSIAMLAGFSSVLTAIGGMVHGDVELYRWSSLLIILALILDGLDGNLARFLNARTRFGGELDTFVDLTAFGIAPAVLVHAVTLQESSLLIRMALPCFVVLLGALRLSRFKATDPGRGMGGYTGLPITANASWVSFFVQFAIIPPSPGMGWNAEILFLAGVFILCLLQVSNVRYPATSKKALYFVPTLILAVVIWTLSFNHPVAARWLSLIMLCSVIGYSLMLPLLRLFSRVRPNTATTQTKEQTG